jgi:hypothetical protein
MSFRRFTKRETIMSLFLGIVLAGSVAFAWWTASGTGNGSATALSATPIAVSATATTADLYPGKTQGSLYVTFVNPNPYPVSLTSITENSVTVDAGHTAACPNTVVSLDGSYPQLPIALAANDASPGGADEFAGPLTNAVSMAGAGTPDGCQGATFTINLTVTGTSA